MKNLKQIIRESINDFDWVGDILDSNIEPLVLAIKNRLFDVGDLVRISGSLYHYGTQSMLNLPVNGGLFRVQHFINDHSCRFQLNSEMTLTNNFESLTYFKGEQMAFNGNHKDLYVEVIKKKDINESNDFEWVNDILNTPPTLKEYIDGNELKKGVIYNLKGKWSGYGGTFIPLPEKGIVVEYSDSKIYTNSVTFITKQDFKASVNYFEGDSLFLDIEDDAPYLFVTPIDESNLNESDDFEWINDIPEANWDDEWTIGDIIGKYFRVTSNGNTFKIIDRENNNLVIKNFNNNIETQIRFKSLREWIKTGYISFYNPDNRNRVVEMDNTLDWLKDMVNDDTETIQFYLDNNLLIEGETYILSGHIFYSEDELYYPVPDFKAIYVGKSNYNNDLLFTILTKYLEIELSDGDIVEIGEEFRVIPREFDYLRIKPLSDNINESDDFEWIEDISEDLNFWRKMGLLGKGKVIKLRGKIYNGTCSSYINLPTEGVIVEVLRVYSDGVLIEFIGRCPTNCEYGDYVPGTTTFIWDDIDGETLFIESTNNEEGLNENNNFDWIEDVLDNGMTLEDYVKNDLLIPGKEYIMTGKFGYYNDDDGIEYSLLPEEGVKVGYLNSSNGYNYFKSLTNFMTNQRVRGAQKERYW